MADLQRFIIAIIVFFFGEYLINTLVSDGNAKKLFTVILLLGCVLFAFFGSFLPF